MRSNRFNFYYNESYSELASSITHTTNMGGFLCFFVFLQIRFFCHLSENEIRTVRI